MFPTNRTFGVELEVHLAMGVTHGKIAQAMRSKAKVDALCEDYNHQTRPHWKVTTDRSLGGYGRDLKRSAEIVSPILMGEEGIQQARRVTQVLRDLGCTVSVRCGLHVHVGANDMNTDQLRALATNFVHCETAFDAIVPPSRRADKNVFILSNRTAFGGTYDMDSINRAIDVYKAADTTQKLIEVVSIANRNDWNPNARRYRKLNMTCFNKYGTVEFRQHSGTVDPDKVENWIRMCVMFVERCKTSKPYKCRSIKPHVASNDLRVMLRWMGASPEMTKFFQDRRKKLAGENNPMTE